MPEDPGEPLEMEGVGLPGSTRKEQAFLALVLFFKQSNSV